MPKMHIEKSIKVAAPVDKIFKSLTDFNEWQRWSPWLIQEPEAKVTVAEDGQSYEWLGNRIGSGNMKITGTEANKKIDYDLNFLKPWKSYAKVWFEMKEEGDEVNVTWFMDSSLPIFMFWMKKMMEGFVGMDYDRGLRMFKDLMEKGEVDTDLDIKGETSTSGTKYVGVTTTTSMEEMGPQMAQDLTALGAWTGEHAEISGPPFTVYHKWDVVKQRVTYTSAIPVKEIPSDLGTFEAGDLPDMKTFVISHKGAYKHLGNAWSTGMNMQQNKTFKGSKKQHPFEVYVNDPADTAEKELVTEVHFPLR
ncbi:MAG: SRPBCC family protein [Bacteroidota bacterium]